MKIKSKVLIIAGSDSSGGAGIQADIKNSNCIRILCNDRYNSGYLSKYLGVKSIVPIPPSEISKQIEFTSKDIKPDAIKIGMLSNTTL